MSEPLRMDDAPDGDPPGQFPAPDDSGWTRVIVKVSTPGHVPDGFRVRARVDDLLFTADATEADVAAAADDANVVSIERGRPLHRE